MRAGAVSKVVITREKDELKDGQSQAGALIVKDATELLAVKLAGKLGNKAIFGAQNYTSPAASMIRLKTTKGKKAHRARASKDPYLAASEFTKVPARITWPRDSASGTSTTVANGKTREGSPTSASMSLRKLGLFRKKQERRSTLIVAENE